MNSLIVVNVSWLLTLLLKRKNGIRVKCVLRLLTLVAKCQSDIALKNVCPYSLKQQEQ